MTGPESQRHPASSAPASQRVCPHCGAPLDAIAAGDREAAEEKRGAVHGVAAAGQPQSTEKDHRGIPMPTRRRVGGIITPQ